MATSDQTTWWLFRCELYRRRRLGELPFDWPMRMAYADPPYPGLARRYYRDQPTYAGEVDHAALIASLVGGGFDGWALSTSSYTLAPIQGRCTLSRAPRAVRERKQDDPMAKSSPKKPSQPPARRPPPPTKPESRPHTVTVIEFVEGKAKPGDKFVPHDQVMAELGL